MRIVNKTRWSTRDLRALTWAVARIELDPAHRRRLRVTFVNARRYLTGTAAIRGSWCVIRIPSPRLMAPEILNLPKLAGLIAHEFAHVRGMDSERDMRSSDRYGCRNGGYKRVWAWANDYPIREREGGTR